MGHKQPAEQPKTRQKSTTTTGKNTAEKPRGKGKNRQHTDRMASNMVDSHRNQHSMGMGMEAHQTKHTQQVMDSQNNNKEDSEPEQTMAQTADIHNKT